MNISPLLFMGIMDVSFKRPVSPFSFISNAFFLSDFGIYESFHIRARHKKRWLKTALSTVKSQCCIYTWQHIVTCLRLNTLPLSDVLTLLIIILRRHSMLFPAVCINLEFVLFSAWLSSVWFLNTLSPLASKCMHISPFPSLLSHSIIQTSLIIQTSVCCMWISITMQILHLYKYDVRWWYHSLF